MSMNLNAKMFVGVDDSDLFARLLADVFRSSNLCSIASVTREGIAHANTAYYAVGCHDSLDLYILTSPASVHAEAWRSNPSVAVTIFDSHQPWGEPHRGVQLFGVASPVPDGQPYATAYDHYIAVYPRCQEWFSDAAEACRSTTIRLYVLHIHEVKLVDEQQLGEDLVTAQVKGAI